MSQSCEKHAALPVVGHSPCAGFEIERLKAEVERYRKYGCDTCDGSGHLHRADGEYFGACTSCGAYELEQAKRESEGLRKDAERYRHLRACNGGSLVITQLSFDKDEERELVEEEADQVIDAAMSKDPLANPGQ
jgi:5,10-methylenetetrahydrofolate reductase